MLLYIVSRLEYQLVNSRLQFQPISQTKQCPGIHRCPALRQDITTFVRAIWCLYYAMVDNRLVINYCLMVYYSVLSVCHLQKHKRGEIDEAADKIKFRQGQCILYYHRRLLSDIGGPPMLLIGDSYINHLKSYVKASKSLTRI